jgi:hypothetical protein
MTRGGWTTSTRLPSTFALRHAHALLHALLHTMLLGVYALLQVLRLDFVRILRETCAIIQLWCKMRDWACETRGVRPRCIGMKRE